MSEPEVRLLLAQIAAFDNRKVTDPTVVLWYQVFQGYSYAEVRWALYHHIGTSTEYLMPAHLTEIVKWKRAEYRMMNPALHLTPDAWLEFEEMIGLASEENKRIQATAKRSAVEAMDSGEFDE
jgi:hypothetical protein